MILSFIDNKIAKYVVLSFMDNKIAKFVVLLFTDNEIACVRRCGLWGGEMNSEAVSMVTRPRFWVAPVGGLHLWVAPLFLGGGR